MLGVQATGLGTLRHTRQPGWRREILDVEATGLDTLRHPRHPDLRRAILGVQATGLGTLGTQAGDEQSWASSLQETLGTKRLKNKTLFSSMLIYVPF